MPTLSDQILTLNGLPVRVLRGGSGPLVLCLHGFTCTADMWRPNLPALIEAGYSVLALDLPGHGETFRPARPYGVTDMMCWLNECLAALGVERAYVMGNSLGGALACEFALAHPAKVERLVLVDAFGLDTRRTFGFLHHPRFYRDIVLTGLFEMLFGTRPWTRRRQDALVLHRPERVPPGTFVVHYPGGWRRNYWGRALVGMGVARELATPARRRAFVQRRAALRAPTLFVWGDHDLILPVAHAHHVHRLIPHSRLCVFPECGHVPSAEYPGMFNREVIEFLAE